MKLKEYLKDSGFRTSWFAAQIPCSLTYLCSIVASKSKPSLIIRRRIADLTGGQVSEDDFEIEERHG